jgi:hypothetical protein
MSQPISLARQRATLAVLEAMAKHPPALPTSWTTDEAAEVLLEWAKIEFGLRRIVCGDDSRAMRALRQETNRKVRMPRIKGVKP